MEDRNRLFSLSIDPVAKSNLAETSRWARVLAIVAILLILLAAAGGVYQFWVLRQYKDMSFGITAQSAAVGIAIIYALIIAISVFPVMYMLRFAGKMRTALGNSDQHALADSLKNLKLIFRFLGIITIISVILMILSLLAIMSGAGKIQL